MRGQPMACLHRRDEAGDRLLAAPCPALRGLQSAGHRTLCCALCSCFRSCCHVTMWQLVGACQVVQQQSLGALRPVRKEHSVIALLLPKGGCTLVSPADLRGIVVGALLGKLYAAGLERRVGDHAEAAGRHPGGAVWLVPPVQHPAGHLLRCAR